MLACQPEASRSALKSLMSKRGSASLTVLPRRARLDRLRRLERLDAMDVTSGAVSHTIGGRGKDAWQLLVPSPGPSQLNSCREEAGCQGTASWPPGRSAPTRSVQALLLERLQVHAPRRFAPSR